MNFPDLPPNPVDVFTNEFALQLMQEIPKELKKVMNMRRFVPPHGYLSPNLVTSAFGMHVMDTLLKIDEDEPIAGSRANLFALGCWQAYHHWPVFAVTQELTEAMFLTDPPGDIKWGELEWPLPAAIFLVPDTEQVRREFHTSKPVAISVGNLRQPPQGTPTAMANLLARVRMPDMSFSRSMVSLFYFDDTAQSTMWHDITAKPEWTLAQSMSKEVYRDEGEADVHWGDIDFERMARVAKLATNFLCFMSSTYQPLSVEAQEGDRPTRKASTKHNRERDALYGVRWLGQGYRLKKAPLGGHHASPRAHWRRGHWRSQACGPGWTMRKARLIQPMWVSGEE